MNVYSKDEAKKRFIDALAEFLVSDQAKRSIMIEMGNEDALKWARLRNATPLAGWPTVDQAKETLSEFLL
jgi:hypothetical protein